MCCLLSDLLFSLFLLPLVSLLCFFVILTFVFVAVVVVYIVVAVVAYY